MRKSYKQLLKACTPVLSIIGLCLIAYLSYTLWLNVLEDYRQATRDYIDSSHCIKKFTDKGVERKDIETNKNLANHVLTITSYYA